MTSPEAKKNHVAADKNGMSNMSKAKHPMAGSQEATKSVRVFLMGGSKQ